MCVDLFCTFKYVLKNEIKHNLPSSELSFTFLAIFWLKGEKREIVVKKLVHQNYCHKFCTEKFVLNAVSRFLIKNKLIRLRCGMANAHTHDFIILNKY